MSNTRFILTNWAEAGTVKNGSGGGAPARDEDGLFTMERALNSDRRSLWKSSSGGATIYFDIDLGGIHSIDSVSVHGFTSASAATSSGGGGLVVEQASSYYPGAWISAGQAFWAQGQRDVGVVFSTVSKRYWRVSFTPDTPNDISVGRIVIGRTTNYNLGGIHSPGGVENHFQNRLEQVMEDGSFNINSIGFPGADFTFPFNKSPDATRQLMRDIAAAPGSVILVTADDEYYEVLITRGMASVGRSSGTLFDVALEARRLP